MLLQHLMTENSAPQARTLQLLMPGTVYLQESLTQDIACTVPVAEPATLHGDGDGKAFSSSDKVSEKARVVFDTCWRRLEERHPVRPLRFAVWGGVLSAARGGWESSGNW